jgi:hypothetical protein
LRAASDAGGFKRLVQIIGPLRLQASFWYRLNGFDPRMTVWPDGYDEFDFFSGSASPL